MQSASGESWKVTNMRVASRKIEGVLWRAACAGDAQLLYRRHPLRRLCSAPPDARCDARATSRCGSRRYGGNQREDSARHVATPARRMNSTSPRRTSHGQGSLHRPKQWLNVDEPATVAALMVD